MTEYQNKLKNLLRELFQFDSADLDFGIYAILNHRREQIEQFIAKDLLQILQEALELESAEQRVLAEEKLAAARNSLVRNIGAAVLDTWGNVVADYKQLPLFAIPAVNEAVTSYEMAKTAHETGQLTADTEAQIYNDLYRFFARYYDDGDFIAQRRFGSNKYAVPYGGQEVYLHWANAGQYYIKNGEHFKDYSFTLPATLSDEEARVFFKLRRAETDRDNNKSDEKRFFVLSAAQPYQWDEPNRTLTLNFEYRPLTSAEKERLGNRDQQDKLNAETLQTLLETLPDTILKAQLTQPEQEPAGRPRLIRHLNRYTARHTRDYFIHQNLAAFLRQELDYFLKNEVLSLDDIDLNNPVRARLALARVRTIRHIAQRVIAFLAQIENFQKRLFEKRKFVLQSDYCLTLDRIPDSVRAEIYQAILNNPAQLQAWRDLYALAQTEPTLFNPQGDLTGIDENFLTLHPHLMLDTVYLDPALKARLLAAFDDLDSAIDGLLIHSENFQALNLLMPRYGGQIKCIYIDPPYNTGDDDGFTYKDNFQHSTWLTMMDNRLSLTRQLLADNGVIMISIDDREENKLRIVCDNIFGVENFLSNLIWKSRQNVDSRAKSNISNDHEFILAYGWAFRGAMKDETKYTNPDNDPRGPWMSDNMVGLRSKQDRPNLHYDILVGIVESLPYNKPMDGLWRVGEYQVAINSSIPINQDCGKIDIGSYVFVLGAIEGVDNIFVARFIGNMSHLSMGMPKPANIYFCSDKGWRYEPSSMASKILDRRIIWPTDPAGRPRKKSFLNELKGLYTGFSSVVGYTREGTTELNHIFGHEVTKFPKPTSLISTLIEQSSDESGIILDFFAGSGTTAHSVMSLNQFSDNGVSDRKYILVEMGNYFDTVLKPRIQKVAYASEWQDGRPVADSQGQSHMFQYLRLESYEDALNNIVFKDRTDPANLFLFAALEAMPDYLLHYMLDFETEGSPALLQPEKFVRPFDYRFKEQPRPVDLVTTFNLLLGLRVETQREFEWETGRVVRVVGRNPANQRVCVLWRNVPGFEQMEAEKAWLLAKVLQGLSYDILYVNGECALPDAQPLEPEFKRLMFATVTTTPLLEVVDR